MLAEKYRLQGIMRTGFDGMDVDLLGGKYNLTDVAARVGLGQLPHLERFTAKRRQARARLFRGLRQRRGGETRRCGLPVAEFHRQQLAHVPDRAAAGAPDDRRAPSSWRSCKERGIGTGVHYPAIHLFTLYRARGLKEGMFPHAEYARRNIVTLPLFTPMSQDDVARVVRAVEICDIRRYGTYREPSAT